MYTFYNIAASEDRSKMIIKYTTATTNIIRARASALFC